jgi:hypothetical protein
MGVLTGCVPRKEVLKGDLEDAIFAADFGDLIAGNAPKVYSDARVFFQNTHPAAQLKKIIQAVFQRLADPKSGGATLRLSTGFGGGKTHTLMALWHLARHISQLSLGNELLPAAGRPNKVKTVAVDAGKGGVPQFSSRGKVVHSLWGEVFYWLGGDKGLKALGKADDPEGSPSDSQIEEVFPEGPVLILLDELVIYMAKLSDRGQGNLLGFINSLAAVVNKRPQTVLIVTDPAGQVAYAKQSAKLGGTLETAAKRLDEMLGRKMSDFDPIGNEAARVIARRLFEKIDPAAAQRASASYHSLYQRISQDSPGTVPPYAADADYANRIVECYPFHPRLLDTAQDRLGALQDFNKSRGVLRLFARILRDVKDAGEDIDLVSAGDINWSSSRIQADLLQRLNRDNFRSAISADIEKHAAELDGGSRGVHCRVASALLLESLPMQSNSGLDNAELTLAVVRPDEAGLEPSEALDRLVGVCWHTYPMAGGRGWQFRYEPNVIKQIEERAAQIPIEDARSRVLAEAQDYFSGPSFKAAPWPTSAKQVGESIDLQLALCEDEKIAKAVCAYCDDSDPKAPIPRKFVNAIVAVTATTSTLNKALDGAQRLMAIEALEKENKTGETAKLIREQLQRVRPAYQRNFRLQTYRAFDRVVLSGALVYPLEEQFQVSEDQMLQRPHGQGCLMKFLTAKDLIYQGNDALDPDRFMKTVFPGTVPIPGQTDVYTARAVFERFLSAPNLRLVPEPSVVRQTLLRSLSEGKIVIRLSNGCAFDANGCVDGSEGKRRRVLGKTPSGLEVKDDTILVTAAGSQSAGAWLKEDTVTPRKDGEPPKDEPTPPPPVSSSTKAITWEKASEMAGEQPLKELDLSAETPAAAAALLNLAGAVGADAIALSVTVRGTLKDSGSIQLAIDDIKPSHPLKPLTMTQTILNSVNSGSIYQATLKLLFTGDGRTGMADAIRNLQLNAPEGVSIEAQFGKPTGSAA